jgi:hypothetical protein
LITTVPFSGGGATGATVVVPGTVVVVLGTVLGTVVVLVLVLGTVTDSGPVAGTDVV